MKYAEIINNTFVRFINLYEDYPNTSFPLHITEADLPENIVKVTVLDAPPMGYFERPVYAEVPVLEAGSWVLSTTKRSLDPSELPAAIQDFKMNVVNQVQENLDLFARSRNYDGILSACSYITSPTLQYQQEAQDCINQRDTLWNAVYALEQDIINAVIPLPNSVQEALALLPVLGWTV